MLASVKSALDFLYITGRDNLFNLLLKAIMTTSSDRESKIKFIWRELKEKQESEIAQWRKMYQFREKRSEPPEIVDTTPGLNLPDHARRLYLPVRESRHIYGVCDVTGCLKEDEVFIRVTEYQNRQVTIQNCWVCVVRNPCYHPGDILLLRAVNKPELEHLVDVVVFSTNGDRPRPDMSSGGDLDGLK